MQFRLWQHRHRCLLLNRRLARCLIMGKDTPEFERLIGLRRTHAFFIWCQTNARDIGITLVWLVNTHEMEIIRSSKLHLTFNTMRCQNLLPICAAGHSGNGIHGVYRPHNATMTLSHITVVVVPIIMCTATWINLYVLCGQWSLWTCGFICAQAVRV